MGSWILRAQKAKELERFDTFEPGLAYGVMLQRLRLMGQQALNAYYSAGGAAVDWTRTFAIGNSKRGLAAREYLAIDPNVAASVQGGSDAGNLTAQVVLENRLWSGGYSFFSNDLRYDLRSPAWARWMAVFGVVRWAPSVLGPAQAYVNALGVVDAINVLQCPNTYVAAFANHNRSYAQFHGLSIPNYAHGLGAIDYLAHLRTLVAAELGVAPALSVTGATLAFETGAVRATVAGAGASPTVSLWCSASLHARSDNKIYETVGPPPTCRKQLLAPTDDTDLRQRLWAKTAMEAVDATGGGGGGGGTVYAGAMNSSLAFPMCVVRVQTADDRVATSWPLYSRAMCDAAGFPSG